jgi:hypothetical protein
VSDAVSEKLNSANKKSNPEGKIHQQQPQSDEQNVVTERCNFRAKNLSIKVPWIIERGKAAVPSRKQHCQSIPEN